MKRTKSGFRRPTMKCGNMFVTTIWRIINGRKLLWRINVWVEQLKLLSKPHSNSHRPKTLFACSWPRSSTARVLCSSIPPVPGKPVPRLPPQQVHSKNKATRFSGLHAQHWNPTSGKTCLTKCVANRFAQWFVWVPPFRLTKKAGWNFFLKPGQFDQCHTNNSRIWFPGKTAFTRTSWNAMVPRTRFAKHWLSLTKLINYTATADCRHWKNPIWRRSMTRLCGHTKCRARIRCDCSLWRRPPSPHHRWSLWNC